MHTLPRPWLPVSFLALFPLMGWGAGQIQHTDFSNDSIVGYLEYLPPAYEGTTDAFPLIIFLHGAGERANGSTPQLNLLTATGLPEILLGKDIPFIVVSPQVKFTWNASANALDEFLDFLLDRDPRIDPTRVYLTGLSDGGKGVFDFPLYYRDRVAAIVPVSTWPSDAGSNPISIDPYLEDPPLPIWGFHGESDTHQPMETWINQLQNAGGEATFELLTGGHSPVVWNRVYEGDDFDIYSWLLEHTSLAALDYLDEEEDPVGPDITGRGLVVYEGFDAESGEDTLAGASGSTSFGWNGEWMSMGDDIQTDGLAAGDLSAQPGALVLDSGQWQRTTTRVLKNTYGGAGEVWISVLMEPTLAVGGGFFMLALTDTPGEDKLFMGIPWQQTTWGLGGTQIMNLAGDPDIDADALSEVDAVTGQTALLVALLNYTTGRGAFWVNPTPGFSDPPSDGIEFIVEPGFTFDRVAFAWSNWDDGDYMDSVVDELRIGGSYASVTPLMNTSGQTTWAGWTISNGWVVNTDTDGPFLGLLDVAYAPWVFSMYTDNWFYIPESHVEDDGVWIFVYQQ